jgi:hypothetical protein
VKIHTLTVFFIGASLTAAVTRAADVAVTHRLGVSLPTLQKSLEKVSGPLAFAPRPGSTQGTQETRLPDKAGVVQAGGDPDNLAVVVLWIPVDQQTKRINPGSRGYLDALVRMFISENEPVTLWLDQVLQRALSESAGNSHLESQLFDTYQLKATYVPSMSPPMLSLTVTMSAE